MNIVYILNYCRQNICNECGHVHLSLNHMGVNVTCSQCCVLHTPNVYAQVTSLMLS